MSEYSILVQSCEKKSWATKRPAKTLSTTPPKINIEPENAGLEDDCPFPGGPYSQVPAVNLGLCILSWNASDFLVNNSWCQLATPEQVNWHSCQQNTHVTQTLRLDITYLFRKNIPPKNLQYPLKINGWEMTFTSWNGSLFGWLTWWHVLFRGDMVLYSCQVHWCDDSVFFLQTQWILGKVAWIKLIMIATCFYFFPWRPPMLILGDFPRSP